MILLVITVLMSLAFVISFIVDKRRFRNAVYLLAAAFFGLIYLAFISQNNIVNDIIFVLLFMLLPLMLVIMSIIFISCGIISMVREGLSLSMSVSIIFGVGIWLPFAFGVFVLCSFTDSTAELSIWAYYVAILFGFLDIYVVFTFTAMLVYSTIYQIIPRNKNCKYIIILGAGLLDGNRVSPLLAGRINKGIKASQKMKGNPKFIVSGGQGSDETVSEARAMADYMIEKGIDSDKIIIEDKSKNTKENLQFSYDIIKRDNTFDKKSKAIFVTNNYHVFRASLFAKKTKIKADGIGCKTAFYYWPNAFVREYIAVILKFKLVILLILLLWIAGVVVSEMGIN